ncbi:hypothetical protein HETIRDRAFT_118433 [Heterobasidion irregulare TC 32-1]|uniref:Uncharacterized protein n=1 Tax=Heterobasidion irregulare (strain TC 32-1) TaxID=747525 RepID=W4JWF0_HETIT|nr:uncharacterized protein HETIRDRAFT_118433 [Heterobasidion irregulare TC 32-1]ETW77415.1 hypothetical protein HETIRDRAFT_118433 [Heterobasidion irregulare TC 32-1]
MQSLFRMFLEGSLRDGEVWVAGFDNRIEAAALWTEPGKDAIISMHENYQALLSDEMKDWLKFHLIPKYKELYNTSFSAGESTRMQAWHLNLVAVDPQHYRRGLGRALPCIYSHYPVQADRNHQTMTADVPTLHSVYFFQSLGFKYKGVKNFIRHMTGKSRVQLLATTLVEQSVQYFSGQFYQESLSRKTRKLQFWTYCDPRITNWQRIAKRSRVNYNIKNMPVASLQASRFKFEAFLDMSGIVADWHPLNLTS